MRYMKSFASVLMALLLLIGSSVSVSANEADHAETMLESSLLGDIDNDGEISILDGTFLQLHIAELKSLSERAVQKGDTDLDGFTTVVDVTHLQRFVAQHDGIYYLGMEIEAAKNTKISDEEAARIAEEERLAQEELLRQEEEARIAEAAALAERTNQAASEYKARLKALLKMTTVEESIKNYKKTKGVDISEYNGDVDFEKLKAAGYTFVMIRIGFGSNQYSQDDAKFEENVKKAEKAGMPWGAYLYSYALSTKDVESEVKHTLRLLKGKKPTMPIAFDLEYDTYKIRNGMPTDKTLHDITLTYLQGIESAGYYPILYTGYYWLTGPLNQKDIIDHYDIWLAQWSSSMSYNTDKVGMWQYGGETNLLESPYIKGLNGMFDKDFCFKNYPVIITAYGYNNNPGYLNRELASTSASTDDDIYIESGKQIPDGYSGVMGNSFRSNR